MAVEYSAVERWRRLVEQRRTQMDAAYARLQRDSSDFWARRAGRYRHFAGLADEGNPLIRRVLALLPPQGSLLDVGAGTGRYTLPLAAHAGRVTALEPSAEMAAHLLSDAAAAGIGNVTVVQQGWLEAEAELPPADVVLCTHVLYPHVDIEAWLRTLDAHARLAVVLEMLAAWGEPPLLAGLWQRFHGEPRVPQPTYIDVYDVLHELGIPANVEVYHAGASSFWRFASLEDAVAAAREHLILPSTDEVNSTLSAALGEALQPDGGSAVLASERTAATVWWERRGPRLRPVASAGQPAGGG